MKLFIYNKENALSISARSGERTIRLNRSNGVIYISRSLSDELQLQESDKLLFANDEENKKDWYLCKTNDNSGFTIKNDKAGVRFTNKFLSAKILDSVKIEANATFLVTKDPTEVDGAKYYRIIVSSPITANVKRSTPNKSKK
ncbi:hypothetical protein AALK14_08425 [Butyricimonas hominis]|uniref:hypothetical protein n=1 Tax=Butyricimonas hominis TaxID=2763032 RepID=UPI003513D88B